MRWYTSRVLAYILIILVIIIIILVTIVGIEQVLLNPSQRVGSRGLWELTLLSIGYLGALVITPGVIITAFRSGPIRLSSGLPHRQASAYLKESERNQDRLIWFELRLVTCLAVLAILGFVASYVASRSVFTSMRDQRFGPAETAQVITAIGGLGLAIGTSIAAVIKAYALLVRARADYVRAQLRLPSSKDAGVASDSLDTGSEQ
jgi:hypothetical protein